MSAQTDLKTSNAQADAATEMSGADIVVESLIREGIDTIFAYPGGASMEMHQSLAKRKADLRAILPRHEQGGSFAAEGYARALPASEGRPPFLLIIDVGYSFELTDPEGRTLIETLVTGSRLAVPEGLELVTGEYYNWSIETRLPDGRKFSNWASFSIADGGLVADVERMQPKPDASVSRQVVFALWLEQNELPAEADRVWEAIVEQRPEAARLADRIIQ